MSDPSATPTLEPDAPLQDEQSEAQRMAALRAARAAKKAAKHGKPSVIPKPIETSPGYIKRPMVPVVREAALDGLQDRKKFKILTWNILAQCLVRRELFPGSDCLKWKDRGKLLMQQVIDYAPDIACLQEVDRLSDHSPALERAGYKYSHVIGGYEDEGKQHGLLIAWREDRFEKVAEEVIRFDDLEAVPGKIGLSRSTRNVALLCALAWKGQHETGEEGGIVIGTQHLFWHARYVYERARQVGVLLRETRRFTRSQQQTFSKPQLWNTFLAGDFNVQPSEATYRLLTGCELSNAQRDAMKLSMVVHSSVDSRAGQDRGESAYKTIQGIEDRILTNVRDAEDSDGLLSESEICDMYAEGKPLTSLYGEYGQRMGADHEGNYFKDRPDVVEARKGRADDRSMVEQTRQGDWEPMWTNFTPLWRCTLDYIFHLPDPDEEADVGRISVSQLLSVHRGDVMEPGLPRLGKEPSDHVALMAEVILGSPNDQVHH